VRNWKPRDYPIAAMFVALGLALSRVLPDWLWSGIGAVGFVGSLWWSARQNRKRERQERQVPPEREARKAAEPELNRRHAGGAV
jgi:hypothetical protein